MAPVAVAVAVMVVIFSSFIRKWTTKLNEANRANPHSLRINDRKFMTEPRYSWNYLRFSGIIYSIYILAVCSICWCRCCMHELCAGVVCDRSLDIVVCSLISEDSKSDGCKNEKETTHDVEAKHRMVLAKRNRKRSPCVIYIGSNMYILGREDTFKGWNSHFRAIDIPPHTHEPFLSKTKQNMPMMSWIMSYSLLGFFHPRSNTHFTCVSVKCAAVLQRKKNEGKKKKLNFTTA